MKRADIINAWATIRKENHSIPDDVLDFMKNAALTIIEQAEAEELRPLFNEVQNPEPSVATESQSGP
jgi:hypothetical protein